MTRSTSQCTCGIDEYTEEDQSALRLLRRVTKEAHLPPLEVADCREAPSVWDIVDEHTLLYVVDPHSAIAVGQKLSGGHAAGPAVMIWCGWAFDKAR